MVNSGFLSLLLFVFQSPTTTTSLILSGGSEVWPAFYIMSEKNNSSYCHQSRHVNMPLHLDSLHLNILLSEIENSYFTSKIKICQDFLTWQHLLWCPRESCSSIGPTAVLSSSEESMAVTAWVMLHSGLSSDINDTGEFGAEDRRGLTLSPLADV